MMHLWHRTIPFIAIAALVTASPAGAQEREDSTSTGGAVMSLLGLGGNFMGFGSESDDVSSPNAWNCGGGCAVSGARGQRLGAFGEFVSSIRSSRHSATERKARSQHSAVEHADLSDYGWSRRVDSDGAALAPLRPEVVQTPDLEGSDSNRSTKGVLSPPSPDGVGQAPSWVAPGSRPAVAPVAASGAWSDAFMEQATGAGTAAVSRTPLLGPVLGAELPVTALAVSINNVAPLVTTVPEPSSMVLLAAGLSSLLFLRSRKTRRR